MLYRNAQRWVSRMRGAKSLAPSLALLHQRYYLFGMSLTTVVTLLQGALMLLTLVQAHSELGQPVRVDAGRPTSSLMSTQSNCPIVSVPVCTTVLAQGSANSVKKTACWFRGRWLPHGTRRPYASPEDGPDLTFTTVPVIPAFVCKAGVWVASGYWNP